MYEDMAINFSWYLLLHLYFNPYIVPSVFIMTGSPICSCMINCMHAICCKLHDNGFKKTHTLLVIYIYIYIYIYIWCSLMQA